MTQTSKKNYKHLDKKRASKLLRYLGVRGNITKATKYLGLRNETISLWIKNGFFPQYTAPFVDNLDLAKENRALLKENEKLKRRNILLKKMVDSI